jgi:ubiquinone/menaquinone biosynthesis C-methylase UbiE
MTNVSDSTPNDRKAAGVDFAAVKVRQQSMWSSGDYAIIGTTLQIVGESLCETVELEAGARVLDVACGNGNAALAAARRGGKVTGVDYVKDLLRLAADRARGERLPLELVEGDAEELPFGDGQFDVVLSTFGVMFAPDQERAARELLRVVRPGGTIGLANWTPDGFIGHLLKTVTRHVPPPAGVASPIAWGTPARLEELFRGARSVRTFPRHFVFRYESPAQFVDVFRTYYGPTYQAFGKLEPEGQARLSEDLIALVTRFNRSATSFVAPSEYLEVVVQR